MIHGKRILALIPARGGSKGLPGKNIRKLCGKPLIAWSIEQAAACDLIDSIVVSTDSEEIAAIAKSAGARVPFLRPAHLASDSASSIDMIDHALVTLAAAGETYDYLVLLEPTSPLREVSDIRGALEALAASPTATSIVGVTRAEASHPAYLFEIERGLLRPMLDAPPDNLRRQDLKEDYYYLEGSIYASTINSLRENSSFYHAATAPWVVDRYKAIEIDELCDFIMAEALMTARIKGELP